MPAQVQSSVRKRTVHQLDTPYSEVAWPEIAVEDQDAILEVLCSLLSPLGQHRRLHVKPSKGKKAAKRQRKAAASDLVAEDTRQTSPLPPPDIAHHVDVGFNSITRNLETQHPSGGDGIKGGDRQYTMIFVARGDQSSTFNCHFPKMVAAASRDLPPNDRIRLVGLSKPCSDKLSKCLGIGRVSSIAITREAPGAGVLLEMVRSHVEPVDVSWLEADRNPQYLATSINAIETTVGPKRIRKDLKSSDEP